MRVYNKRGITPVIATLLLVGLAVIIAAVIFMWARSTLAEQYLKFNEPVDRYCEKVSFGAEVYTEGTGKNISLLNTGNVPIYGFKVYAKESGQINLIKDVQCFASNGAPITLDNGESCVRSMPSEITTGMTLLIVPQVLAERGNEQIPYLCDNNFGEEIEVS